MTTPRGINSKHNPRNFLKRGFKSMFSDYGREETAQPEEHRTTGRSRRK